MIVHWLHLVVNVFFILPPPSWKEILAVINANLWKSRTEFCPSFHPGSSTMTKIAGHTTQHHIVLQNQASDTELSFTERAMLLGIAVKWFSNLPSDQQQKTQEDLQDLHKKRWLFKIRAEIEKDFVVRLCDILIDNLISIDHCRSVLFELNRNYKSG